MKKILISFIYVALMTSLVGCVNTSENIKSSRYETEILHYLEEKYSEDFVINKIITKSNIGESGSVVAQLYSKSYPGEYFDVIYHLKENCFKDNYCNVVLQNKFDKTYYTSDIILQKTIFETTNQYPSINSNEVTIDDYIDSLSCPLYICNMIFVEDDNIANKDEVVQKIVNDLLVKKVDRQFIYIHFTDKNSEFIKEEFGKYYEDAVMHFKNAEYVTEYEDVFIKKGDIQSE